VHTGTLDILRCPYCGGRLSLVTSLFHETEGDEILDGILGCHCCIFPVVAGIPVLHVLPAATTARAYVQAGRPDLARRSMFGLEGDQQAEAFDAAARSETATYRDLVEALGPTFEGGYFLYRFSDPTYVVADAVVRAVAGTVLATGGRAVDICGGSGHLTRSLVGLGAAAPVLADLYFAKVWLGRRFTAPGCEAVCCDGNAPMPFARGAFRLAMCVDAFMYIWTKRQFVGELERLIDGDQSHRAHREHQESRLGDLGGRAHQEQQESRLGDLGGDPGAILIGHTHNELQWCPSHGQPLSPAGYRNLFETIQPRIFGESSLFADVVKGGPLDLSRRDPEETVNQEVALTIIASRQAAVFQPRPLDAPAPRGEIRVNPLYTVEPDGDQMRLRLQFPSEDYKQEYGACREYLPDTLLLDRRSLAALADGRVPPDLAPLVRRRVLVDLPRRYY
jgi:uncharacterized protein YbaR (Trm112 family)